MIWICLLWTKMHINRIIYKHWSICLLCQKYLLTGLVLVVHFRFRPLWFFVICCTSLFPDKMVYKHSKFAVTSYKLIDTHNTEHTYLLVFICPHKLFIFSLLLSRLGFIWCFFLLSQQVIIKWENPLSEKKKKLIEN